jgi:hypothetical protein
MQSFEFQVVVDSPLETMFALYSDIDWWRGRASLGNVTWAQGQPWEEGSRMRIESRAPIRAVVDQVVLEFKPRESVVYISHVLGITCESRIRFAATSATQCIIQVKMQLVGNVSRVLGFAVEPTIERATRQFFDELKQDSEAAARRNEGAGGT